MRLRHLLLAALACAGLHAQAALRVVACEPEWASLATELGGDRLQVSSATTALQDPHRIEARPSLIARVRNADLLVCTGLELEVGWLPVLVQQSGNAKVAPGAPGFFEAGRHVSALDVPQRLDRSDGDVHAAGNPHIQLDPRNIALVAKALAERLAQLDPPNARAYQERHAAFAARWAEAERRWSQQAAPLKGLSVVEPSAGHLSTLKAQLAKQPARLVVRAAYQDPRASQWLSDQARIPAVALPFTVGGNEQAKDLFGLFDSTIALLLASAR
jgi:zinc/manganese transport system substrate-binding protein